jgi:hypothetical protein
MTDHATMRRPPRKVWTVADLYRRFGPIAFERIRQDPPAGCGTVDDVVLSRSNTAKEMAEKLRDYFEKGVRLVWFVRPKSRVVDVYTAPDRFMRPTASMRLDGEDVLPGFSALVGDLFEMPKRPAAEGEPKKNGRQRGKKNGRRGWGVSG